MVDTNPKLEGLFKINEAAQALQISPRHCWGLIKKGQLRCVRLGRAVRVDPADLRACIENAKDAAIEKASGKESRR